MSKYIHIKNEHIKLHTVSKQHINQLLNYQYYCHSVRIKNYITSILFFHKLIQAVTAMMCFNSSPPSAAYMRQWIRSALVKIMACHLFGAKPLSKLMWDIVNWTLVKKLQWNFNRNLNIFINENTFENTVCAISSISSQLQCVKCGFFACLVCLVTQALFR